MSAVTSHLNVTWTPYLRPSPIAAEAALRVLSVGELDASTLALVIGSDPGLTAMLVRATEPAAMGASIAARIAELPPARLHSALYPGLVDALATHHGSFSDQDREAWRKALATAIAAECIAQDRGDVSPDAAYLAGLLHNAAAVQPEDRFAPERTGNVRAIARRYKFPAWLIDSIEGQDVYSPSYGESPAIAEILRAAKTVALEILSDEPITPSRAAAFRRAGPGTEALESVRERAARSLERRMSLFAFDPSPARELHAALLRFSNHLLLYWRVDETSAAALRERVKHLDALVAFERAATPSMAMDEVLITCADRLRSALAIPAGLVVAWPECGAPAYGARWNTRSGALEPLQLEVDGAPAERSIQRLLAGDVWPVANNAAAAPDILSVYTPAGRHAGYVAVAHGGMPADAWREHVREWAAALGRAVSHIDDAARDDARIDTLRRLIDELRGTSDESEDTGAAPSVPQRHIARAVMAALHAPLSAVTAQAHQLVAQPADPSTQGLVEELAKQARNAARVLSDLRAVAGGGDAPNEFILINAPLRQFLHAARARLERRAIQVHERFAEGLPRIRADVRELNHLFTNLFAFIEQRMGHTGRTITVATAPGEDRASVCVTIGVTGMALTQSQAEGLFQPLAERESASTEFALSLAACRAIVDAIGGSIRASTSADGVVLTVEFEAIHAVLAVERDASTVAQGIVSFAPVDTAKPRSESGGGARVLIVDDDEVMRDLMKQALARKGYTAETVKDGDEAIRFLRQNRVDLVLLDLLMPNRDGLAVLRELRDESPATPVIVMTGSRSAEMREEAMDLGARSFLQKPFELGQLLSEVESVLVHQRA
ncbi:MAG: response regulator [Candidatus Hydrogenedentes bacterium]|nr:response regulator [Candidatus Hydrogenedentota bacterium]